MSATSNLFERHIAENPTSSEVAARTGEERRPRVLFINRSYWPDNEATGQLLTELTEDLSKQFDVSVIAGRPNVNTTGEAHHSIRVQYRNGVRVLRVPHLRLPKHSFFGRGLNFITFLIAALLRGLILGRQDVIVVESDPFLLPYVGWSLRLRHNSRFLIYLQDIHPNLGLAIGHLNDSLLMGFLSRSLRSLYRRADRVVVLSEDMRQTLISDGIDPVSCTIVPNWVDTKLVNPERGMNRFRLEAGIPESTFLVMYSGNLGVTQQLELLLEAAEQLRDEQEILFAFIGSGSAKARLESIVQSKNLTNVRFFPYQPKENLGSSLSAADLHVISVHPNALDYLMPSKLYGIMAAGRPVLAVVRPTSQLARVIESGRIGTIVPPGNSAAIAAAIQAARLNRASLELQGQQARRLVEMEYNRPVVTPQFAQILRELLANPTAPKAAVAA